MTSRRVCVALLSVLLIAFAAGLALGADIRLKVYQDENATERVISRYLKATYSWTIEEVKIGEGDLMLVVPIEGENVPDFNVVIDTEPSAHGEAGGEPGLWGRLAGRKDVRVEPTEEGEQDEQVTERLVSLQIFTDVKVPAEKRGDVLEAINELAAASWFASIYIDEDDEVACQWSVNIMKQGLPTDYVFDALVRLVQIWEAFHPMLMEALGGEG